MGKQLGSNTTISKMALFLLGDATVSRMTMFLLSASVFCFFSFSFLAPGYAFLSFLFPLSFLFFLSAPYSPLLSLISLYSFSLFSPFCSFFQTSSKSFLSSLSFPLLPFFPYAFSLLSLFLFSLFFPFPHLPYFFCFFFFFFHSGMSFFSALFPRIYREEDKGPPCPFLSLRRVGWHGAFFVGHGSLFLFFNVIVGRVEGYGLSLFGQVREERAGEKSKKAYSSLSVCGRKEEHAQCRSKRHCFEPFWFTVYETTSFFTKCVISFKKKWHQKHVKVQIGPYFVICSIKSSIAILILRTNSTASSPKSDVSPKVGRSFHVDPWSWIYAIGPSLINKLLISSIQSLIQSILAPLFTCHFHFGSWFQISSIKSLIDYQTSIIMQLSP